MQNHHQHVHGEQDLPPGVEARLRRFAEGDVPDSGGVDQLVFREAAGRLAAIRMRRFRRRIWAASGVAAVAATIVLSLWVLRPDPNVAVPGMVQGDFNGDGAFDVLDAFALARNITAGAEASSDWDCTGDGAIDGADVEELMRRVVVVSEGGAS